jgi:hypothetical protein
MSINSDLRALRMRSPTLGDVEEIHRQIVTEKNDRGTAILAATLVENAITYAISRQNSRFAYRARKLFENNGPISTLDAKILIADCFGMLGPNTRHNLDIIKHIRNTFAHARIPITFITSEIESACHALREPPTADMNGRKWDSPREKFGASCYAISKRLLDYASRCIRVPADILDPATMVPVTPPSLP